MNKLNTFPSPVPVASWANSKCQKQHACRKIHLKEIRLRAGRRISKSMDGSNRLVQSTMQAHKRLSSWLSWAQLPLASASPSLGLYFGKLRKKKKKKANTYTRSSSCHSQIKPACKNVFFTYRVLR